MAQKSSSSSTRELKHRVFACLNKLSDRDTYSIAATELESIAKTLAPDSLSIFLSCIHSTDSSDKSPVRKQCVRLLGFLSETHGDALSPYLSKMISNIVRRLRDPDTSVRSACVQVISTMSSQITKPPFAAFLKPLADAVFTEQDYNSQVGSALCLAAAIEASPDPDCVQLRKMLPRFEKLLKVESYKAKHAVLTLIGSVIEVRGACGGAATVRNLVTCLVEFLRSEDWAARKAAAEALTKLAEGERDMLSEFKDSCLKTFENRKFDKVKAVRESMIAMLEAWKEVPDLSNEASPPPESQSSSRENASDGRYPPGSKNSPGMVYEASQLEKKHNSLRRSSPPGGSLATTGRKRSPLKSSDRYRSPATLIKRDKKHSNWKTEISGVWKDNTNGRDENCVERRDSDKTRLSKPESRRVLFSKNSDEKTLKCGGSRSGSRVVPCDEESFDFTAVASNKTEDLGRTQRESEDLSLIRKQLVQIENQQSSLLDLLQRFIGSSQNGMRSLETRVHGLELALDEISHDLAVSKGRMKANDPRGVTCCMLPGTEFLSSKFWRKTENGRHSTSRFSTSRDCLAKINGITEPLQFENRRFQLSGNGRLIVNPLAEIQSDSMEVSGVSSNRLSRAVLQSATTPVHSTMRPRK